MKPALTRFILALGPTRWLLGRISKIFAPPMVVFDVHLAYDEKDGLWYVAKSDIPGLCAKADDLTELIRSVERCAREMIGLRNEQVTAAMPYAPTGLPIAVRPVFDSPLQLAVFR